MVEKTAEYNNIKLDISSKIIENIDSGILILDENLTILYYNQWLEIRTKHKLDNAVNKNLIDLYPNINQTTLLRKIKTALTLESPTFYTATTSKYLIPIKMNHFSVSESEYMPQDVSIIPLDIKKRIVSLVITEQTNMTHINSLLEENIKKINELNTQLVKEKETIDKRILFIKLDIEGKISDISKAYLDLIGFEKEELLGINFFDYEKLHLSEHKKKTILKYLQNKSIYQFEEKTLTNTGKELWFLNTLTPEYDVHTRHTGYIIFRENITNKKKVINQQEKMLQNSRSAAMGEMISMIAHQWRQPLSVINTIIASLKIKKELKTLSEEYQEESLHKIEKTVAFLSETIDDFKNYFKPNKQKQKISLDEVFNKSTTFLLDAMKQKGIKFVKDINKDILITTYQNELIQCVISILKNSIDAFAESNVKDKTIEVRSIAHDNHTTIYLIDNGGGIDAEIINKVFEPYFSTKSKNGTGLGLYMSKTIVEDHLKGRLTIFSEDIYTTVIIELPYTI